MLFVNTSETKPNYNIYIYKKFFETTYSNILVEMVEAKRLITDQFQHIVPSQVSRISNTVSKQK